jgi:uncharacterized membrane protein
MSTTRRLQIAAVVVLIVAYSVLSHYSNGHAQARDLATLLALAPMSIFGLVLLWRLQWLLALAGTLLTAALLYFFWSTLKDNFPLLYLVQQAGFYLLMAATFGVTLLKGWVPLCTQFADRVHGPLNAAELTYTRQVTAAWAVFFLLNLVLTFVLFGFAPLRTWSLFVNFVSLPLIALMFIGEYLVRRRVLKQVYPGGLMATLRVYFAPPR